MRKWICCLLLLVLGLAPAYAAGLPDVGLHLGIEGQCQMEDYAFADDYHCNVWVYARPAQADASLAAWLLQALEQGYTLRKTTVEGQLAYQVAEDGGLYALLFPEFQGAVMLLVQQGMAYGPTPTATPAPEPTRAPSAQGSGQWEWVTVEKDCPSCVGGVCSICHGTGTYRLYGEAVSCSKTCTACDGKGTYTTREYRQIIK